MTIRAGQILATGASVGVGAIVLPVPIAAGLCAIGALAIGIGTWRASRREVTLGSVALLSATVIAGLDGLDVLPVLVAGIATVFAWDVGDNAVCLRTQIASGRTTQAEITHATVSIATLTVAGGVSYAGYRLAASSRPAIALSLLLFATIALLYWFAS